MARKRSKLSVVLVCVLLVALLLPLGVNGANKDDKVLYLRLAGPLASTDWEQTTNTRDQKVWHQMFEGLYGQDESGEGYYKELAEAVELSEDKLVYTIKLRGGVKFQNGEPLKASDVVFSYERAMKNPRFNYVTSMIDKIEEVDDGTVKMTLKTPYSPIDHTFFSIKIASEKEVTEQGDTYGTIPHKAGTGAYYVSEYDVAAGVKFEAFEDYWRGAPDIKHLEYIVIPDNSSAIIAFENNELNYFENVPLSDWAAISEKAGEDHSALVMGNYLIFMGINYLANDKLANIDVRKAIMYALDKEAMNDAAFDGKGTVTPYYMQPEYVATSPKDGFETYEYSPEKAKEHLAKAGYPDGVDVGTILTHGSTSTYNGKVGQVMQAQLEEVGIHAELSIMDISVVNPRLYVQDYDICIFNDSGNYDFNNFRQQVHSESEGMYVVKYKDGPWDWQKMEELIDKGVSTSDIKERTDYYRELFAMVMDTATMKPLLDAPVSIVWSKDLDIGTPVPTYYKVRTWKWTE